MSLPPRCHRGEARPCFWEEGLLWSAWKATQEGVQPFGNLKKECSVLHTASNSTTAVLLPLPEGSRQTAVPGDQESRTLWLRGKWCSGDEQHQRLNCPTSWPVSAFAAFWVVARCPFFGESKGRARDMDNAMMRAASLWESGAWGLGSESRKAFKRPENRQWKWMESLWQACYELRNYKQTWHADWGAQQNPSIAHCYKSWDSRLLLHWSRLWHKKKNHHLCFFFSFLASSDPQGGTLLLCLCPAPLL